MKKTLTYLLAIALIAVIYIYRDNIVKFAFDIINPKKESILTERNDYYLKYKYSYFNQLKDIKIESKKDIFNLYYTITNNGYDNFTFYCPNEYANCIEDIKELVYDQKQLSIINGFVHPFNSFQNIRTEYNSLGEIDLKLVKTYSEEDIKIIKEKMDEIIKNEIKDEKNIRNIIKIIHDYIIKTTKYDKDRADNNVIRYRSNTAYGVLFEGYGICGGYTDTMALFLDYYDIPNFEISSENHIWNAVYLEGKWYHLDLTWDDPIVSTGEEIISDNYFLITTEQLDEKKDSQHNFDRNVYKEIA